MILFINTCIDKKIILALKEKDKILKKEYKIKDRQAEKMVVSLDNFFTFFKKDLKDLRGVVVANGLGKFTSLRVGISTANAISYALNIPIIGIRFDEYNDFGEFFLIYERMPDKKFQYGCIKPLYDKDPNITINAKFKNQNAKLQCKI